MFEHMKNYEALFRKISTWLKPESPAEGRESLLFVHIFCHKDTPYHFEEGDGWMAQTFFSGMYAQPSRSFPPSIGLIHVIHTGGTMPSHDLFVRHFKLTHALMPLP